MKTIALLNGGYRPTATSFAGAVSPAMRKAIVAACDDWMPIGEFYDNAELMNNPQVVPVLTTLVSTADRLLLEQRRQTVLEGKSPLHTALWDHPFDSANRNKAGRLCLDGITIRWKENVPHRPDRVKNDWGLKPWMLFTEDLPLKLMHCPSNKRDEYALFLQRDEETSIIEVNALMAHLKQARTISEDWQVNLRPWTAPGFRGGVMAAIRDHVAVVDGNSVLLLDALREGRHAIVWKHPDKPLATTLASYWPCTLAELDDWTMLHMEREPLFEFLDNADVPFEALDNRTLKDMIAWQIENLDVP